MKQPLFRRDSNVVMNQNLDELTKQFSEFYPGVYAKEKEVVVSTGDNTISPTVPRPRGRLITFQDAAATFFDKGLDSNGLWVLNASAPCTIRIAFF